MHRRERHHVRGGGDASFFQRGLYLRAGGLDPAEAPRTGAVSEGELLNEFPVGTVCEMICNAVCHRSWFQPAHVQVALYDDRLEVTSPSMLSRDVIIQKMKEGISELIFTAEKQLVFCR